MVLSVRHLNKAMNALTLADFRKSYVPKLLSGAKARSKKHGWDLSSVVNAADLVTLWEQSHGRCAISGHEFTVLDFKSCLVRHPYAPSLDRKDFRQGYTLANTRLVCVAVNFGVNQWGADVYQELARAAVEYGKVAELDRANDEWLQKQKALIKEAERKLETAADVERAHLKHVLAGLRATITKGRDGAVAAAKKAGFTRKRKTPVKGITEEETVSGRLVQWLETKESLDGRGHGVVFLHREWPSHAVAFLEDFSWLRPHPSKVVTVKIAGAPPASIAANNWSKIIQSTRAAVVAFLSNETHLDPSFVHGPVRIGINA